MVPGFKKWLLEGEVVAGPVDATRTDNFCCDDGCQDKIPSSRFRMRNGPKIKSRFNPDKKFGYQPRYSRLK